MLQLALHVMEKQRQTVVLVDLNLKLQTPQLS